MPQMHSAEEDKICFASMAADAPFVISSEERTLDRNDPQLSSMHPQVRGRYKLLTEDNQVQQLSFSANILFVDPILHIMSSGVSLCTCLNSLG